MSEQQNVQEIEMKSEKEMKAESRKRRPPGPGEIITAAPGLALEPFRERLRSERVELRLQRLPGWKMQPNRRAIDRVREFPDTDVAAAYANFAVMLAGRTKQPLRVTVLDSQVAITLLGYPRRHGTAPVNEKALEIAELLG